MSVKNIRRGLNLILNKDGFYDLYSNKGVKVEGLFNKIEVTQSSECLDTFKIEGVCNVFRSEDEMNEFINSK